MESTGRIKFSPVKTDTWIKNSYPARACMDVATSTALAVVSENRTRCEACADSLLAKKFKTSAEISVTGEEITVKLATNFPTTDSETTMFPEASSTWASTSLIVLISGIYRDGDTTMTALCGVPGVIVTDTDDRQL
jgi:hypothetical protein